MEPNSPRKIQFTVPLLEPHLDPEAAEQIRRRRPTPANLVLSSDQSSPEIDEDRLPNPLLKSGLAMSPRQRKKVSRTTPTMKGTWGRHGGGDTTGHGGAQGVTNPPGTSGDERLEATRPRWPRSGRDKRQHEATRAARAARPLCRRERGDGHQGPPRPPSAAPCPAELQMMVEHHLCKQAQGGDDDDEVATTARCHRGDPEHRHSPGGSCPLATPQGGHRESGGSGGGGGQGTVGGP
uniref:Protein phosphatase 1 regulatory subunit 1A n=1 Tax=Corvus moneduloides TaxID=1196302 RepID=A0A8U7ND91_CORMO